MAVGENSTEFCNVPGVKLGSVACGIKKNGTTDLVLFEFSPGSVTAGVFTTSHFAAAPVQVSRQHISGGGVRYFLINSGNANAATGEPGVLDARSCCAALSQHSGSRPENILPFSTGVIGERLPVEKITNALPRLMETLSEDNWLQAAKGIMTTDTRPKICSRQFELQGHMVTITGIAKGAGMIAPNMATLLTYVATDVSAEVSLLQSLLGKAANQSFNRITVDSDTSTNDSCMLTATAKSGAVLNTDEAIELFATQLNSLMLELAQGIVRDAEGATKFVEVRVDGGASQADSLQWQCLLPTHR